MGESIKLSYFRIQSFYQNGRWTGADHIYLCKLSTDAIEAFRRQYPEHKHCIIVCEPFDKEKNPDVYKAFLEAGCVHFWDV